MYGPRGTISTLKHSRYGLLSLNVVVSKSEPVQITSVRIMGFILNLLHFFSVMNRNYMGSEDVLLEFFIYHTDPRFLESRLYRLQRSRF